MSEPESADNRIERIIRKWEMLYVSFTKIDARVQTHGVEEGVGGQGGHRCKKCVIARCQSIVTFAFEGAQSLRLTAGQFCWRHDHFPWTDIPRHRATIAEQRSQLGGNTEDA